MVESLFRDELLFRIVDFEGVKDIATAVAARKSAELNEFRRKLPETPISSSISLAPRTTP